jgi:hypothetical protein
MTTTMKIIEEEPCPISFLSGLLAMSETNDGVVVELNHSF